MKSYDLPDIQEPINFKNFIKFRKGNNRKNLLSVEKKIPYYYRKYNNIGFDVHQLVNVGLSDDESKTMLDVYGDYTSKAVKAYRKDLFEHIRICPYCGLGETEHLDHYLPKSQFAEYALFTSNLLPCCYKCNSDYKSIKYRDGFQRIYFHPYIDNVNDFEILKVSIRWSDDAILINYMINNRSGISPNLYLVLKQHFSSLELNSRYLSYAISYVEDMMPRFRADYGVNQEEQKLIQAINSRYLDSIAASGKNNWLTALLKALKADETFTSGGFVNV